MFTNIKLYFLCGISLVIIASCGGGGGGANTTLPTITLGVVKGVTAGATCILTDVNHNTITATTLRGGYAQVSTNIAPGAVFISCAGGTYQDEASGTTIPGVSLRGVAYYTQGDMTLIASPLSEISYQKLIASLGSIATLGSATIVAHNNDIATLFGLNDVNIMHMRPTDLFTEDATQNKYGKFAVVLAGISQLVGSTTASAGINNLARDIADNTFNTKANLMGAIHRVTTSGAIASATSNIDIAELTRTINIASISSTARVQPPMLATTLNTQTFSLDQTITPIIIQSTNTAIAQCSHTGLPAGLSVNGMSTPNITVDANIQGQCVIMGKPLQVSTGTYTVNVANIAGTAAITIAINTTLSFTIRTNDNTNFDEVFAPYFAKKIEVFEVPVYAVNNVPDDKLRHVANVLAQYLDNDSNGAVDNQAVVEVLKAKKSAMIMWHTNIKNELRPFFDSVDPSYHELIQDVGATGAIPEWHDSGYDRANDRFDSPLEEVLHLITHIGYDGAYPNIFGERPGSAIANAMDAARGGRFINAPVPPNRYPEEAWFTYYNDPTPGGDEPCDYACMVTEYVYWGITSILGAQAGRDITEEWELRTREEVQLGDPALYNLLTDPQYKLPTILPNGHYRVPRSAD